MIIYTSYYNSPIGLLEMIGSKHAIHALRFVQTKTIAEKDSPPIIADCLKQLEEYFSGNRKTFSINVEQGGTDYQKFVWKKLEDIPYGKTISYLDLARNLGDEKSARAVGNANGKNKIPVIIPCHRVIGTNDSLVGYAGGIWRKQWLLDHEKKFTYGIQTLF